MTTELKSLVLMQYPVFQPFVDNLKRELATDFDVLVVSTIAASGHLELVRKLRRKKYDKLYIVIADDTVVTLTSILMLLSVFVRAGERYLLYSNHVTRRVHGHDCGLALIKILRSLVIGGFRLVSLKVRIASLLRRSRAKLSLHHDGQRKFLYYFRTNLWLGVQAGGALSHTKGVISAAAKAGWQVSYFSADQQGIDLNENIKFVACPPKSAYVVPRELNHVIYNDDFLENVDGMIAGSCGVIYQRTSIANYCGVAMSRKYKLPLVVEYNGAEGWLSRNWGTPFYFSELIDAVEQATFCHAHLIITVSAPLRDELLARGIPSERVLVQPNGVDLDVFNPRIFRESQIANLRASLGIPRDATVVSFLGTFGPWHGVEVLAETSRKLLDEEGSDNLYFLLIGDGVRRKSVEAKVPALIAAGRVVLTGLVPPAEVPKYLAASDILTAPTVENPDKSEFFGSPTKLFEYMACERVVVASGLGQILEVFEGAPFAQDLDESTGMNDTDACGILIRPGNSDDLARAIRYAEANPEWSKAVGANARQRVQERYTWDQHVRSIFDRLSELIQDEAASRPTVLINALHSKSGGGVTYLRNLLPYLRDDGRIDVHVCIHQSQRELFGQALDGIQVHEFTFKRGFWGLLLREQIAVPLLAKKIGASVTFSPANYGPILARGAVLLLRNSLAVAFVERRLTKLIYWGLLYLGTAASMITAKRIISVSRYASRCGAGSLHLLAKGGDIIPHGVSPLFRADATVERADFELLVVADIYVQKNLHTLVDAFPAIVAEYPRVSLRIAGAEIDADYASKLKAKIERLGLSERIYFEGSLNGESLSRLYQRCTVFVFPSTVETFGNPLVEAMASACAIACSNTAAMPEIVGGAASYFDPNDPGSIADAVKDLLGNAQKRRDLSQKAQEQVKSFSWKNTAEKTIDVLVEVANEQKAT